MNFNAQAQAEDQLGDSPSPAFPTPLKPFLKWAGGKLKIAAEISAHISIKPDSRYFEPFLGAGAVFFHLRPRNAYLSDANPRLIDTFKSIRDRADLVNRYLSVHQRKHSEQHFYETRQNFNAASRASHEQAARFIYLNKASFNGIYRVNTLGQFNVPFGHRAEVALPSVSTIEAASLALVGVEIECVDFEASLVRPHAGDVVYLDPPYPPLSSSAYFTHYTKERFNDLDQSRVANIAIKLRSRGCQVVISNADTQLVRHLFNGWKIFEIDKIRWVTSGKVKHVAKELIIVSG